MKPDLKEINKLLLSGKNFSLTEKEYIKKTKTTMPKDLSYLKNRSAISRLAQENGYSLIVKERIIYFEK